MLPAFSLLSLICCCCTLTELCKRSPVDKRVNRNSPLWHVWDGCIQPDWKIFKKNPKQNKTAGDTLSLNRFDICNISCGEKETTAATRCVQLQMLHRDCSWLNDQMSLCCSLFSPEDPKTLHTTISCSPLHTLMVASYTEQICPHGSGTVPPIPDLSGLIQVLMRSAHLQFPQPGDCSDGAFPNPNPLDSSSTCSQFICGFFIF